MRPSHLRSLLLILAAAACSTGPSAPPPAETVGRTEGAILHGDVDETHPAVVALLLGKSEDAFEGSCTGTIVKVDAQNHVGWVATAAHCVQNGVALAVQAEDYGSAESISYGVIDWEADRHYTTSNGHHDFAMIRIAGVDASTPVLPLTTAPDGLAVGSRVTSVGYGMTSDGAGNTKRNSVDKTLAEVTDDLLGYDQATSGICFGDSGGPVIAGSGASERVVGIHSFVTQSDCTGKGYSARVADELAFFEQQLAKPLPKPSCELCEKVAKSGVGPCSEPTAACLADAECRGYYECIGDPKKTKAACFEEFPLAEGPFTASASCVCDQVCADTCGSSPSCANVGKCGAKLEEMAGDDCAACLEGACCDEVQGCTADGRCYFCLKEGDSFSSCKRDEPRNKLAACARDRCATECADSSIGALGEEQPADAGADAAPPPAEPAESGCSIASSALSSRSSPWQALGLSLLALALARRSRRRSASW